MKTNKNSQNSNFFVSFLSLFRLLYNKQQMLDLSTVNFQYLEDSLCNKSGNVQLAERFRSLFTLKNIANDQAIDIISRGTFIDRSFTIGEY